MSFVDYKFGSDDKCPAKTGRITSQATCKRAAIALGNSYEEPSIDSSSSPSGCFATEVTPKNDGDSIVAFNSNKAGSKGPGQKLLCAAGAPFSTHSTHRPRGDVATPFTAPRAQSPAM